MMEAWARLVIGKRAGASGLVAIAAFLGLALTASPLLAAEKHPPKYPPLTWCKQNPSRTTEQYATDYVEFFRNFSVKSQMAPKEFSEVPSDVIVIPEHLEYAITGRTEAFIVPTNSNDYSVFGLGSNDIAYFTVWDICKVVGPTGEAWLVEGVGPELDYIPMEKAVPLSLYLAEIRLTRELRAKINNKIRTNKNK